MKAAGISKDMLIPENRATNTGENARYSYEVLKAAGINAQSLLLVTKPYMERRALATFEAQWPDKATTFRVTSQGGTIEQYCSKDQPFDDVVNIMVGDLQRILEYPKLGFQTNQVMGELVSQALETLKQAGFTEHLL